MHRIIFGICLLLFASTVNAQQIFKCATGKGGNTYQQTPCASESATKKVVKFKREPDAPRNYDQYQYDNSRMHRVEAASRQQQTYQAPVEDRGARLADGYVKCTSPTGSTYIASGKCKSRSRSVPADPQPGMVTNVRTGQQRFMVPAGNSGFIDPATGQHYNRVGAPPRDTVRTVDASQPVTQGEVCAQARAAAKDYNRTMDSIREAERRIAAACGQ